MEIIIALAIILSTLVIYAGSLATIGLVRNVRDNIQAYRIAVRQMEILRATDFAALPTSGIIVDPNLTSLPSGVGNHTVSDYPGTSSRLKQAQVTVSWVDNNVNRQVQLNTLMGETGFNP